MEETVINTNSTVNKSQEITVNIRINSSQKTCPVLIKENATLRDLLLKAGFGVSAKFFINSKGYLDLEYLNKKLYELGVENGCQLNIYKKYKDDGDTSFHIRPEATDITIGKNRNQLDGDDDVAQDGFVFKLDSIYGKIDKFNSTLTKMQKMSIFPKWVMINRQKLECLECVNCRCDLNQKNKFTDDERLYSDVKSYNFIFMFGFLANYEIINNPPSVDKHLSKFKEMTNREFLKLFIKDLANKAKWYRPDSPKWKDILYFVGIFLGTHWFFYNSNECPRLNCFLGALNICAYAGLVCYFVFNLSTVLIPSVIVLGLLLFVNLILVFVYRKSLYDGREAYGENVKQFFDLVGEINQYLDTFDLPQEKISSGKREISKEPSIDEKIQDANTKKDDKEESDIKTEKSNDEKDRT